MKVFLIFVALIAVVVASEVVDTTAHGYHLRFGIPRASKIKQAEAALDFDGGRIIGGGSASLGSNPHLGGLVITLTNGWTSVCGSSLLSNTKLVTAAHCWFDGLYQASHFVVVLGSLTLFSGGTRITTSNVQMHENWKPVTSNLIQNDVAVITINWVGFNNNIQAINLASGSNNYVNTWATASGYGITSSSQGGVPSNTVQMQVNLQVISNALCASVYGGHVIASTICTSGHGIVGTCGGDSGGPLNIGSGNSKTLIGITSFGSANCALGNPSAFARITSFNSWIQARL